MATVYERSEKIETLITRARTLYLIVANIIRRFPSPAGTYPLRRLKDMRMLCMFVTLCKDLGIEPVNLLKQKMKFKRFGSLSPTSSGISPRSWFEATARITKEEMLYRDRGTLPVRLLTLRTRCFRFLRRPKSAGISPPRLLVAKFRVRREEMFAKDGGIVPERLFPPNVRISSLFRLLSSSGIAPEISFCIRSRIWRFKHVVRFKGIGPVMLLKLILRTLKREREPI
ncbi:hypothetical protein SADUNF_Sadunf05G0022400 [Salix dunnii]|uniref:Uncharacterized protein n=1 Tax=Salix dunnii TaxID=1413687 RepID=A0A835MY79_9ROSI|nr:hypothetical protein SADUNF_Sadunf05G0022400 [Salix dunnii]